MSKNDHAVAMLNPAADAAEVLTEVKRQEFLLKTGALQDAIFNSANFSCIATDEKGVIQIFNVGAERMLGYTAAEVINKITPADISDPQELIARAAALSIELQTHITPGFEALVFKASRGIEDIYELTKIRKDGSRFPAVVSVTALRNALGEIIGYLLIGTDNTARKQAEEKINELSRDFVTFLENTSDFIYFKDENSRFRFCSQTLANVTGHTSWRDMIGKHDREVFPSDTAQIYAAEEMPIFLTGKPLLNKVDPYYDASGNSGWVNTNKWPLFNPEGKVVGLFGISHDISALKKAEDALRETESRFRTMANYAPVLIWIAGPDKLCNWFNKVWLDFTGRSLEQELGNGWTEGVHPDDFQRCLDTYVTAFDKRLEFTMEYRLRRFDGDYRWLTDNGVPRYDEQGVFLGYIGSCIDLTDRHQMNVQVQQLAFYDTVTKLPNRRLLNDRLAQTIAAGKRTLSYAALMFLDLDNFKLLNDTHGHDVGDLLLIEVADRLTHCVREMDTVARFGGDEFVVILSGLNADEAESTKQAEIVAEKIRMSLSEPYVLSIKRAGEADATVEHHCTASIGVKLFMDHQVSPDDLLKWADAAMYQAKKAGRNRVSVNQFGRMRTV